MASKEQYFQEKDGALFVLLNVQRCKRSFCIILNVFYKYIASARLDITEKKDHTTDGIHRPVHYRILNIRMLDFL